MQLVDFNNRSQTSFVASTPKTNNFESQRSCSSIDTSRYSDQRLNKIKIYQRKTYFRPKSTFLNIQSSNSNTSKPKRSIFKLIQISILFLGIELLFSIETALTVPLLLKLKVPDKIFSFVYIFSPLMGVIFQPVLGLLSDRCTSRFGRRRPFVLLLSIGAFFGILLILNGSRFGEFLGDNFEKVPIYGIVFTVVGVLFLDFFADSADNPLKGFLLDVCNSDDQDTALNIHATLGCLGGALGLVLGAIDWTKTVFKFIGDEFLVLFTFSSSIFVISLILTLVSVKEKPFVKSNDENSHLLKIPEEEEDIEDENTDSEDQSVGFRTLIKSLTNMPKELFYLMMTEFVGWQAYFSTMLFLTDFIGTALYKGDPTSAVTSIEFKNYNTGVKMGCWCLLSGQLSGTIFAFVLEKFLLNRFSMRNLFFFGFFYYAICQACIYFTNQLWIIIILCSSYGILSVTLQTLPYQILSEYHQNESYRLKSPKGTRRGLGVDCALLSSCYFLSQTVVGTYTSLLISVFGSYFIIIASSICAFIGCIWISLFMIFPLK